MLILKLFLLFAQAIALHAATIGDDFGGNVTILDPDPQMKVGDVYFAVDSDGKKVAKLRITSAGPQTWEAQLVSGKTATGLKLEKTGGSSGKSSGGDVGGESVVSAVNGNQVEIDFGKTNEIEVGQSYYLLNPKGKKKGIVQVTEVHEGSVTAELKKGVAEKGWSAVPRAQQSTSVQNSGGQPTPPPVLDYRNWNVKTDLVTLLYPISFGLAWTRLAVERRMGQKWSLGGEVYRWSIPSLLGFSFTELAAGVSGTYKFADDLFSDGIYVGASAFYYQSSFTESLTGTKGSKSGALVSARAGWQWVWESFNFSLGYSVYKSTMPAKWNVSGSGGGSTTVKPPFANFSGTYDLFFGWCW